MSKIAQLANQWFRGWYRGLVVALIAVLATGSFGVWHAYAADEQVAKAQRGLKGLYVADLNDDGELGPKTKAALRIFFQLCATTVAPEKQPDDAEMVKRVIEYVKKVQRGVSQPYGKGTIGEKRAVKVADSGDYTAATYRSVKAYQAETRQHTPDGIAGGQTRRTLQREGKLDSACINNLKFSNGAKGTGEQSGYGADESDPAEPADPDPAQPADPGPNAAALTAEIKNGVWALYGIGYLTVDPMPYLEQGKELDKDFIAAVVTSATAFKNNYRGKVQISTATGDWAAVQTVLAALKDVVYQIQYRVERYVMVSSDTRDSKLRKCDDACMKAITEGTEKGIYSPNTHLAVGDAQELKLWTKVDGKIKQMTRTGIADRVTRAQLPVLGGKNEGYITPKLLAA